MLSISKASKFALRNSMKPRDRCNVIFLGVYLGCLFAFSSMFYLATEDYEAVTAVQNIQEGFTIGKSTGWPYAPLTPYLFYPYAAFFGESILGFRLLTAGLLLGSIIPIYFTLRRFAAPFVAFGVTLFSFSLTTFPHPRLEYYVEAAFLSFAIYFAIRFIQQGRQRDIFLCAAFVFIAFAARGYPNLALLLGVVPAGLIAVEVMFRKRASLIDQSEGFFQALAGKNTALIILVGICTVCLLAFLKNAVFHPFLFHYGSMVGPASFRLIKEYRNDLGLLLLCLPILIFFSLRWAEGRLGKTFPPGTEAELPGRRQAVSIRTILLPFAVCGLCGLVVLVLAGYSVDDILFFLLPLDVLRDHVGQTRSGRSYVIPLFFSLGVTLWYLYIRNGISSGNAKVAFFLVLLLPATFARFFPGYNMLYLGGFVLAVFIVFVLPQITGLLHRHDATLRLQHALAIFLIVYSLGSNMFLMVRVQLADIWQDRLKKMDRGAVTGIYVEKDIAAYFRTIYSPLAESVTGETKVAFFSHRYLKFAPMVYNWHDVVAGHNLMIHLGRLWSYDDVVDIEGTMSSNWLERNASVYTWRQAAVDRLRKSDTSVIVMSLYNMSAVGRELLPSSDPFREYLRKHFVRSHVIEPAMQIHRRSAFAEGAIIFHKQSLNR